MVPVTTNQIFSWFNHMKSTFLLVESLFFAAKVRLLAGLEGGAAFGATTHFGEETGARLGHVFLPRHGSGGWLDESDAWKCDHLILVDACMIFTCRMVPSSYKLVYKPH
jgi:hypothetical protein